VVLDQEIEEDTGFRDEARVKLLPGKALERNG
jgi:hypothetical protein